MTNSVHDESHALEAATRSDHWRLPLPHELGCGRIGRGLQDDKQYECAEQSTRHFHLLIGQSSLSRAKLVAAECASALRGELVEDSLERDPTGAVLRATPLK